MTAPTFTFWTQEELVASLKKNGLDKNDQPLKDSYIKSSAYNLTSSFMEANATVPKNLTGMVYKRFLGLLFSEVLKPLFYEDKTPQLSLEGKQKNYISSKAFCGIMPSKIKGNKVKLKPTIQEKFKTIGLIPSS